MACHLQIDVDPAFHFDVDPDLNPACHLQIDVDPAFHFDVDPDLNPDPTFQFELLMLTL